MGVNFYDSSCTVFGQVKFVGEKKFARSLSCILFSSSVALPLESVSILAAGWPLIRDHTPSQGNRREGEDGEEMSCGGLDSVCCHLHHLNYFFNFFYDTFHDFHTVSPILELLGRCKRCESETLKKTRKCVCLCLAVL